MARASVDKQIWQARKRILDLEEHCRRVADKTDPSGEERFEAWCEEPEDYECCDAAFVEYVADTLRNVNWILHDAEGDAIRERQQRSED